MSVLELPQGRAEVQVHGEGEARPQGPQGALGPKDPKLPKLLSLSTAPNEQDTGSPRRGAKGTNDRKEGNEIAALLPSFSWKTMRSQRVALAPSTEVSLHSHCFLLEELPSREQESWKHTHMHYTYVYTYTYIRSTHANTSHVYMHTYIYIYAYMLAPSPHPKIYLEGSVWPGLCHHRSI